MSNYEQIGIDTLRKQVCSKKKYPHDYQPDLVGAIKTIIADSSDDVTLFGSSVFKSLQYAGDVDILQYVDKKDMARDMQAIILKIRHKGYLIGDIKAGYNDTYIPLIKYLGGINKCKVIDYDPKYLYDFIKSNKIEAFNNVDIPSKNEINIKSWMKLHGIIHNLTALRWTPNEILNGVKYVDKRPILLEKAVLDNTVRKIDMYAFINDRFLEITNILFTHEESNHSSDDDIYQIKLNMLTYLYSDKPNYSKALKRAYTLARIENKIEPLKKIYPYLNSNLNLLSNAATDINVLKTLLNYGIDLQKVRKGFLSSLSIVMTKLSNFYLNDIDNIVNAVNKLGYNLYNNAISTDMAIESLGEIESEIKNIVNIGAKKYIEMNNINLIKDFCP